MKTLPLICLLAACGFGPTLPLHAQQAAATPRPVPPPPPWLDKAPDFAQWTITIRTTPIAPKDPKSNDAAGGSALAAGGAPPSSGGDPHAEKPKPVATDYQTVVVKTKPLRYERTVVGGGVRTAAKWFLPDLQITTEAGNAPVVAFAHSHSATDYGKADFPGFEWIAAGNFEGVQKVSGVDCLVFREPLKSEGRMVKSDPPLMSVACIGVDSKMPVALQLGDETRTYSFGQAPTASLTLPPEIEALATQWRSAVRQASQPVARP